MTRINPEMSVGGRDILATESLVIHGAESVFVTLRPADGVEELKFEFQFRGEDQSGHNFKAERMGDRLVLAFTNFNNPIGLGTNSPLRIGLFRDRSLWLGFVVHAIGEPNKWTRSVTFTFYLGDGSDDAV